MVQVLLFAFFDDDARERMSAFIGSFGIILILVLKAVFSVIQEIKGQASLSLGRGSRQTSRT
jgi:hypothetical protein